MPEAGQNLSHYRLIEKIGEGGMGVVWKAEDTKLRRDVALKFLPEGFAGEPDRLARFEREAHFLASLNHPNIAAIYGFEEEDDERFLVLELVPGTSLAECIKKGSLPVDDALKICCEIARALEAAHEKGVIHRDLKPGNVQITPKGQVKVLDFGLAKAFDEAAPTVEESQRATVSIGTGQYTVVGTTPYMSPEQASAKPLDKRTDIWSFGCILYEVLTGRRAFAGETVSSTIAAIHSQDPDWDRLPPETPASIHRLMRRCLAKDSDRRLHDIADGRIEIDEALSAQEWTAPLTTVAAAGLANRPTAVSRWVPWLVALAMTILAIAAVLRTGSRPESTRQTPMRVTIPLSDVELVTRFDGPLQFDVTPDRRHLVYVGREQASPDVSEGIARTSRLYLLSLDNLERRALPDTEGASQPFFSPDGAWVGFFSPSFELKKVPLTGGPSVTLHTLTRPGLGADWSEDGTIVFGVGWSGGLWSIPDAGGQPEPLTHLDKGEVSHRWPHLLPGGKAVIYTIKTEDLESFDDGQIAVVVMESGQTRALTTGGAHARYVPTGHLVFGRGGSIFAAPFDKDRLEVTGPAVRILAGIVTDSGNGVAWFRVSLDGTLFYRPESESSSRRISTLQWIDREGNVTQSLTPSNTGSFEYPRLSPDGRRLSLSVVGANDSIWILDLNRETFSRLTFGPGNEMRARWTPDGKTIVFVRDANNAEELLSIPIDGGAEPESLGTWDSRVVPTGFSPDGELLIYHTWDSGTDRDIHVLSLGQRETRPLLATSYDEGQAALSPDGRWMVYESNESGRYEVYVRPFPGPGGKIQVSPDGGTSPRWRPDGRELFYRNRNAMMLVEIGSASGFAAGIPRKLFEAQFSDFTVSADGQRFLVIPSGGPEGESQLQVVLNWFEELERKMPEAQ